MPYLAFTMQQPPYGYAPTYPNHPQQPYPQQPYPQQSGGPSTASIASIAKPTVALLGIRAAIPVLTSLFWWIMPSPSDMEGVDTRIFIGDIIRMGEGLVAFVALVFFWIWFARVYSWVRATRGGTRFSNGMAIGGWFIPFANFAIPYLAMRDAWRRAMNDENGGLVLGWWLAYLSSIVVTMFFSIDQAMHGLIDGPSAQAIYTIIDYTGMAVEIGAWGLWIFLVQRLTRRATTGT